MKLIDPQLFEVNHPQHWEVEEKHIGNFKNKIVIIKNWFVNPEPVSYTHLTLPTICSV